MEIFHMVAGNNRRASPRSDLPILIHIPRLCPEKPLRPKDISMGGFKVELEKKPDVGSACLCGVRIEETVFSGEATVVWVKEELGPVPPRWQAGLLFRMPEEKEEEFEKAIAAVRSSLSKDVT
jgi:hypothetical protein